MTKESKNGLLSFLSGFLVVIFRTNYKLKIITKDFWRILKMDNMDEHFERLDELIRKVSSLITPYDIHDEMKWLMKRDVRQKMFEKFPKCFLSLRSRGREIPFLPVCNRQGMEDPQIIAFSMKLAHKLKDKPDIVDRDHLDTVMVKLQHMHNRFNKEVPKPPVQAAKKGMITRMFKNIKGYLDQVRSGETR